MRHSNSPLPPKHEDRPASQMRRVWRRLTKSTTARACLAANFIATMGMCSVPLLGVQSVDSAFVLGLFLPLLTSLHAERVTRGARSLEHRGQTIADCTLVALLQVTAAGTLLAINGLRIGQCQPWTGLAYILLGPGLGCLAAALVAPVAAHLSRSPPVRRCLALAPALFELARFAYRFYATPTVFSYGHTFGYFPGSLYDELIAFPLPLLSFRATTICAIAGTTLLYRYPLALGRRRSVPVGMLTGLCLVIASVALEGHGAALGFRSDAQFIQAELGATIRSERCNVHAPREYRNWAQFSKQCDAAVHEMEAFLGLGQRAPIEVYLFRSANEKRRLIGAAGTNIAKPWRNEVYVQVDTFPHPVLPHEIAHVVAGNIGRGPLRISGSMGGLWPNPGIIEGVAVAADFRATGGLTPHQWAKAALKADLLPPLVGLFGPGFFNQPHGLAYTVAGSFLHYMQQTDGRRSLRRLYQTADVVTAFGTPLAQLETRWHDYLHSVPLPQDAAALAHQRFSAKSVLSSICPHAIAELKEQLRAEIRATDSEGALQTCNHLLAIDEQNPAARLNQIATLAQLERLPEAEKALEQLGEAPGTQALSVYAEETIADAHLRVGHLKDAADRYKMLLLRPMTRPHRRQLRVKLLAANYTGRTSRLLAALLVPARTSIGGATAVHLARELRPLVTNGLPQYLEARQLYFADEPSRAATLLVEALRRGLPHAELREEALRLAGLCYLQDQNLAKATEYYGRLLDGVPLALRDDSRRMLRRIRYLAAHPSRADRQPYPPTY